jgi:hypothetical protein
MSRGFVMGLITIRFGFDRMKQFPRGHVSRFNAKVDGHHRLEAHGIPCNTRSPKRVQVQQQLLPE